MRNRRKNNRTVVKSPITIIQGIVLSITLLILQTSCNDPTLVGTSLFDDDIINIKFTDTIDIQAVTVKGDSTLHANGRTYLIGEESNTIFGNSAVELYLGLKRNGDPKNKFYKATIDKVELVMFYDTIGYDPSFLPEQSYVISMFKDSISDTINVFRKTPIIDNPISKTSPFTFNPKPMTDVNVLDYVPDTFHTLVPQLRIELSDSFKDLLTSDTTVVESDSVFATVIKGIHIKSVSTEKSLVGFNLSKTNYIAVSYKYDTTRYIYKYLLGTPRYSYFEHDYEGSTIQTQLDSDNANDDLLYLQGLGGTNIEVDLKGISAFEDKQLNHAELEFYVVDGNESFTAAKRLLVRHVVDGKVLDVIDASLGTQKAYLIEDMDNGVKKYRLSLTNQIKAFFDDSDMERKISISIFAKNSTSNRSIIYGTNHPEFPMRLKTVFTEL